MRAAVETLARQVAVSLQLGEDEMHPAFADAHAGFEIADRRPALVFLSGPRGRATSIGQQNESQFAIAGRVRGNRPLCCSNGHWSCTSPISKILDEAKFERETGAIIS